jgi:prepilin-type N-terminal cleavage/methylation domain-containing protein
MTRTRRAGFTLIEMSIVLVIVGLIAGGVFAGKELIQAAKIRATISQIEMYNVALNTFQAKYTGLPGDLEARKAAMFGFVSRLGAAGMGDGDGWYGHRPPNVGSHAVLSTEALLFWSDLDRAGLIEDKIATASATFSIFMPGVSIETTLPRSKLGQSNFFTVYSDSYLEGTFYFMGPISFTGGSGDMYSTTTYGITPAQALSLDAKMDDGQPALGAVQSRTTGAAAAPFSLLDLPQTATSPGCASFATDPPTYDLAGGGNTLRCHMRFKIY